MVQSNGTQATASQTPHGLLTPDNCVVALIDYQPQMLFGVANFDRQGVINGAVGLAKSARAFDVPVVLSTVETTSFSGPTWPQLLAALDNPTPVERSSMNAWEDAGFRAAIQRPAEDRVAGLWTEACVAFPTISAIEADTRSTFRPMLRRREPGGARHGDPALHPGGAVPMTWIQVSARVAAGLVAPREVRRGHGHREAHGGAYGVGVEYAYTMVHGAPASQYPTYTPPQPAHA